MHLNDHEKAMLNGDLGDAQRLAMQILTDLGETVGAERMIEIARVHADIGFYSGRAGLDFIEKLEKMGARAMVPTTTNACNYDLKRGLDYGVPKEDFSKVKRLERAALSMGFIPAWTCAPYQDGLQTRSGQAIACSESNVITYMNSIVGARTNRVGDLIDICAAITGRFPEYGLYITENRKAEMLVKLDVQTLSMEESSFYPLLGYLLGAELGTRIAAIQGLPSNIETDSLKDLCAALATSGPVGLIHLIGITPEAHSPAMCRTPNKTLDGITVTPQKLLEVEEKLWTAEASDLDWVALGCPHFSISEFKQLAEMLSGRLVHPDVAVTVFTSRKTYKMVEHDGTGKSLIRSGVEVYTDGCPLLYPQPGSGLRTVMTNSAKAANYAFSQSGCQTVFSDLKDCAESAVEGKIVRRKRPWSG